jgi:hypothetical protein
LLFESRDGIFIFEKHLEFHRPQELGDLKLRIFYLGIEHMLDLAGFSTESRPKSGNFESKVIFVE